MSRRSDTTWSERKGFIIHNTANSTGLMFVSVPLSSKPKGVTQRDPSECCRCSEFASQQRYTNLFFYKSVCCELYSFSVVLWSVILKSDMQSFPLPQHSLYTTAPSVSSLAGWRNWTKSDQVNKSTLKAFPECPQDLGRYKNMTW